MKALAHLFRGLIGLAVAVAGVIFGAIHIGFYVIVFGGINVASSGIRVAPSDDWRVLGGLLLFSIGWAVFAILLVASLATGALVGGAAGAATRQLRSHRRH